MEYAVWNNYTNYLVGDLVSYAPNGIIYKSILGSASLPNINKVPPSSGSYWVGTGSTTNSPTPYVLPNMGVVDYPLLQTSMTWSGTQSQYNTNPPIRMFRYTWGAGFEDDTQYLANSGTFFKWKDWIPMYVGTSGMQIYFYDDGSGNICINGLSEDDWIQAGVISKTLGGVINGI